MPDREHELLVARLDERVKSLERDIAQLRQEVERFAASIKEEATDAEKKFVKKEIFLPVQKAVFSIASLIIFAVLAALLGLVLPKH